MKCELKNMSTVTRFELKRSATDWRFVIAVVFSLVMFGIGIYLEEYGTDTFADREYSSEILSTAVLCISVTAALLASGSLVSEFERGTGLVIFTKPVSRNQVFAGKFLAAYLMTALVSVILYAVAVYSINSKVGYLVEYTWMSLPLMLLYSFAAVGVCMLFSSLSNKEAVSAIICLFALTVFGRYIHTALQGYYHELPWYSLNYAASSISSVVEQRMLGLTSPDITLASAVMIAYGVFSLMLAALVFNIRENR